jgi:hypothetical protein
VDELMSGRADRLGNCYSFKRQFQVEVLTKGLCRIYMRFLRSDSQLFGVKLCGRSDKA